jgi:TolA-binding protein
MYVARFYLSRKQRKAASVRLEGIWIHFPGSSLVPDAMFLQAQTFLEMDQEAEATRIFNEIIERYPDHHQTKRARDYLEHMAEKSAGDDGGSDG